MGQVLTNQDVMEMNCTKELYIQYGRFCERHGIENYKDMNNYDDYIHCGANDWENGDDLILDKKCYIEIVIKHQIINFLQGLIINKYKAILLDSQYPITIDDDLENWLYELMDNISYIVKQGDVMNIIHKDKTKIKLTGYKDMSDGEIIARKYLDKCEYGDLIIKDCLEQVEFEDNNFKNTDEYYNKCKDITNIRTIPEDDEHYNMNWDCIIVGFGEDIMSYREEIWQRA
jgi:hypothetical protein